MALKPHEFDVNGRKPGRHVLTKDERRRGGKAAKQYLVPFVKGFDPRRHKLTLEDCRKGGLRSWLRFMYEWRRSLGLPIPYVLEQLFGPEQEWWREYTKANDDRDDSPANQRELF